jgi:hypothetical protein
MVGLVMNDGRDISRRDVVVRDWTPTRLWETWTHEKGAMRAREAMSVQPEQTLMPRRRQIIIEAHETAHEST